ncbi:non-ribosomal peptide synthetase [Streptantibioticus cattleyicolor]|uniref:Putative linear pentadecapeptide gramicidin synthetase LgrB n=1 Tax=Streptantibioticus cattleyicolor (strain ATCC 35852 / DSM 46488 / JCM 4925 / NBRC 14057 / NRRL 8057) TaxID=1003195 RepID=F8JJQ3_STREN
MGVDHSPLASAQQRLWFLWRLRPDGNEYNVPKATRLRGTLDAACLERALARLVERHAVLRATFPFLDGEPVLRIARNATVPLGRTDLSDTPAAARHTALRDEVDRVALGAFDLVNGPVFRAQLIRLAEDDHVLVLAFHHIVVDGWSLGVIERELAAVYAANLDGAEDPLPVVRHGYQDHVAAEREMLSGPRHAEALEFWRRNLASAPRQLPLPTDRPHPPVQSYAGDSRGFTVAPQLSEHIRSLAARHRASRFVVLLSAYAALLSRLASAPEVVIGVPVSGRTTLEAEAVVGLFVNMLPLRIRIQEGMTFAELLRHVRDTFLAAHEYQDLPFQRVVEDLQPERLTSRNPIFQCAFTYEESAGDVGAFPGLEASPVPVRIETAKFELTLHMAWSAERVEGWMGYQTDVFDGRTAELLGARYLRLLSGALAAPDTPVARLPLLGAEEERTVLAGGPRPPAADGERVERMVERHARERPDAVAVRAGERALTYAQLDQQANLLATVLRASGAGPGTLVATCLPRGVDLVIAELGIVKTGAAYLPLDPANPPPRLAAVLTEADPLLTVADSEHTTSLPTGKILTLERIRTSGTVAAPAPAPSTDPADLAYVVYTSGSTGRPKGVMVEHRALSNLVAWHHEEFGIGPGDRTTLMAAPGFDASAWEIWSALTAGATLEVPDAETVLSPRDLIRWLVAREVTSCFVPTPLAERLARADWPAEGAPRSVLTGGDRLRGTGSGTLPFRLVNNYGPTESTVVATSGTVQPEPHRRGVLPDIGRPIAGVEVYVLDAELRPVPVGVPGELYLGGVALARGYLNQPGLTADRFVPSPYGGRPGARLYRTGDLVRWRSDGSVDFLGRNDHQVKIRGFRIEPGEIENVLRGHPGVRDAIVTTTPVTTGSAEPALVAYLVRASRTEHRTESWAVLDDDAFAALLRDHLRDHLPRYMVPGHLVVLPRFPLNPSGKVDRAALPVPELGGVGRHVGPRDEIERVLAGIWSQVLGRQHSDVTEDFFEIGGDSLKSIQVVHRAREAGLTLTVSHIFHHPTIEELGAHLRQETAAGTPAEPVPEPLVSGTAEERADNAGRERESR